MFFGLFGSMFLVLITLVVERETGAETSKKFNKYGLIGIVIFVLLGLILNFFVPLPSLISTTLNLLLFVMAAAIAGESAYIILRRRREKASPAPIKGGLQN